MTTATVAALVEVIRQQRLLDPAQLDKLTRQLQYRFADPHALGQDLVRRGWLNPQQVHFLLQHGSLTASVTQPAAYGDQKTVARRRWLMFNVIGGIALTALVAVLVYVIQHNRRDAEAARLAVLEAQAQADLQPIQAGFNQRTMEDDQLRKLLLAFRIRYAEVPAALRAAELLSLLPSPLDVLGRLGIAKGEMERGQPENLVAVLGERRWRHWGAVRTVAVSPTGTVVASAGEDNVVRLWEKNTGREIVALSTGNVLALTFLSGGKLVAGAAADGNVILWEADTGKKYGDYPGPARKVVAACFSRDGLIAASAQEDGNVKVWELESGKERGNFRGHDGPIHCVAFAPDGEMLASGGADGTIKLWRPSGAALANLAEHSDGVLGVAFSPDGKFLASGGGAQDRQLILWDVARGEAVFRYTGHEGAVSCVTFTADQKHIVSGSGDQAIRMWEVRTNAKPAVPAPNNNPEPADNPSPPRANPPPVLPATKLLGHAGAVLGLALVGEGDQQTLASAGSDGTVRLWNMMRHSETTDLREHQGPVSCLTFLDDGRLLATGSHDRTVKLWNLEKSALRTTLAGHTGTVHALSYAPADKVLASGSQDGTVKLWDTITNKETATLGGHVGPVLSVALSPDGKSLAVGAGTPSMQGGQLRLWTPAIQQERATLEGHADVVAAVAFAPDGRTLASGSYDGVIRLWEPFTTASRGVLQEKAAVVALAVAPDGKSLAAATYARTLKIWDLPGKEVRTTVPDLSAVCRALAYAPDGKRLAAAQQDGKVVVWNPAGGAPQEWQLPGAVHGVAFAPDSRHLATANANGTIYVMRVVEAPVRRAKK